MSDWSWGKLKNQNKYIDNIVSEMVNSLDLPIVKGNEETIKNLYINLNDFLNQVYKI